MNQYEYERIYGEDEAFEVRIACGYGICENRGIPHTITVVWPGQETFCSACHNRMTPSAVNNYD